MKNFVKRTAIVALVAGISILAADKAAYAGSILFNFNSPNLSTNAELTTDQTHNPSVQTYMNQMLAGTGLSVALSGSGLSATSLIVSSSYTGDNHVVEDAHAIEETLGTNDGTSGPHGGANDNFLYTYTGSSIVMDFTGFAPNSQVMVGFDYEIFPDGSCSNDNTCGSANIPDFRFLVNGTSMLYAQAPNVNGVSPAANPETDPQLGPSTYGPHAFMTNGTGELKLEFDDWPATIGVDNLSVTTAVPEPGTMLLLGAGLAGFLARRRRQ